MSDIYDAALRRSAHIVARAVDPDELTALRAEVERLNKSRNKWGQKYNKLLEKHKVTRDELATQIQWVKDLADKLIEEEAKTSTLRAENERLRAALRWFVDEYDKVQPMRQARVHAPDCRCVLCAYENARAALNDQPAPGKEE